MARIKARIVRLENQNKAVVVPILTDEEKAFIDRCDDWIRNNVQPDLSTLAEWQKEMYAVCVRLTEEYC